EVKELTETEEILFETIYVEDNSLEPGVEEIAQAGIKGEKEVIYEVTYKHGKEINRTKKSDGEVTIEPVNEIIRIGPEQAPVEEVEEETVEESIPFKITYEQSLNLKEGEQEVIQEGAEGVREITYQVTLL